MLESLLRLDYIIWGYINVRWHNSYLDTIMVFARNQWTWAPLYLFLALFIPRRFGRNGWIWCAVFILTFALSDQLSATVIKPLVGRLRPCNDPYFQGIVHIIVPCGGGKSFPSSHAANHFSLAIFSSITLSKHYKWVWVAAIVWATLVAYAQVYVGVHYPLDVLCGGIIGAFIGLFTGSIFRRKIPLC